MKLVAFNLGYFYSDKMKGARFTDNNGKDEKYYMGSFGIGMARTIATAIEVHNDENGMIWPESIAPYTVSLISIAKSESDESYIKAQELYSSLTEKGIEVLWDDRIETRPGEKFADADLIGIPHRVIVSSRSLENGGFEYKKRSESDSKVISEAEVMELLR
ncbi:MAG: His/Gly/Thr/Pro-type tRNA ligase C-terminal domain-containing protein [Candidatus Dojkabacteria bacterium]|nr:His/Gly/Thr/Pro-type tRNA ligase C-terminal domain-containing protein [Candidatus Dojkabacteria bacterium]